MTIKRLYTFGPSSAQRHWGPDYPAMFGGRDLCVIIEAETGEHCRATMANHFGREWAFEYTPERAFDIMPELVIVPPDRWPAARDDYHVDDRGVCVPKALG